MRVDRRTLLLSSLAAPLVFAARRAPPAALLVPLTGERAGLGLSMARAAALGQPDPKALLVEDTAAKGAAAAAQQALRRGARLILGPVFSAEVRPVLAAAAGRAPVVAFSNDLALRDSGAFLLGLAPADFAAALLRYARGRGVRTVAVSGVDVPAGLEGELGLSLRPVLPADVAREAQARPFDALLAANPSLAAAVRAANVQLLLATASLPDRPEQWAALDGAWLASPDPDSFGPFADRYRTVNGGEPGLLAALAHDAALVAARIGAGGRAALLDPAGFAGATGPFRFRADGTAARTLAILVAGRDGYTVAARQPTA